MQQQQQQQQQQQAFGFVSSAAGATPGSTAAVDAERERWTAWQAALQQQLQRQQQQHQQQQQQQGEGQAGSVEVASGNTERAAAAAESDAAAAAVAEFQAAMASAQGSLASGLSHEGVLQELLKLHDVSAGLGSSQPASNSSHLSSPCSSGACAQVSCISDCNLQALLCGIAADDVSVPCLETWDTQKG
jgi:hypothetical protein